MSLILHWGGARHRQVDDVPDGELATGLLVYDGPQWFGVYVRFEPHRVEQTERGPAEVWTVRE